MKNLLAIALICMLAFACKKSDDTSQIIECEDVENVNGNISNQEEYDIIEAVLSEHYSTTGFLHIVEYTEVCSSCAELSHSFLSDNGINYDSTTVSNYALKNDIEWYWNEQFNTTNVMINKEELNCFFDSGNGWNNYYAKYEQSSGYLQFGRPATNGADEAIVHYGEYCNYLCAAGFIVLLEKIDGVWQVKHNINTWIS